MNIYFCDIGIQDVVADTFDVGIGVGLHRYEQEQVFELIAAPTRGKVRRMMSWKYDLDFTDKMSIRKLMTIDDIPEGFINNVDLEDELDLWGIIEERNLWAEEQS